MVSKTIAGLAWVMATGFSFSGVVNAAPVQYRVDPAKSELKWVGQKVLGQHDGTLKIKEGTVVMDEGKLKSGTFVLDMKSIKNNDLSGEWKQKLEGHLKSKDFFAVDKYPTATFKTTKVQPQKKAGEYSVTGQLTMKDKTKPVTLPLTVSVAKSGEATAAGKFSINRLDWDVKYNSGSVLDPKTLGDKMIDDEIGIDLTVVAVPAQKQKSAALQPGKKTKK